MLLTNEGFLSFFKKSTNINQRPPAYQVSRQVCEKLKMDKILPVISLLAHMCAH